MADLTKIIPDVRTHLSGSAEVMVLQYLRRAAKQFCQDSLIWEVLMGSKEVGEDPLQEVTYTVQLPEPAANPDATPPVPDPDFTIPANSYINSIATIQLDDEEVDISRYGYDIVTNTLSIRPRTINNRQTLKIYAILEPTKGTNIVPDFLLERWGEGIADYAIWEMMSMSGREWSDRAMSVNYKAKYESRVSEAKVSKARKGTTKAIRLESIEFV